MSSNLVIVAIPDENDRVWKISSEKVPHLTLLFLGEVDNVANLDQIIQFVEHAASTTLRRFYLPVDRRGELGADQADVLFFKKGRYDYKAIREFRSLLLKDPNIKTAYDSATQFEAPEAVGASGQPWIPHLTLGYPATPAKPVDDDQDYRLYDVCFNKIAVWTDDFEGMEFLLKDYEDEFAALDSVPMDVAMGDIQHVGVKGMRWGVRKEDVTSGVKAVGKAAKSTGGALGKAAEATGRFAGDVHFESQAQPRTRKDAEGNTVTMSSKARELVIKGADRDFRSKDLATINSKPEYVKASKLRNRLLKPLDKTTRAYRNEVKQAYINRLETTANSMKNPSGTREYTIRERGGDLPRSKYYWEVSSREARHSEDKDFTLVEVLMDEDGFITGTNIAETQNSMAQTVDLGEAFLAHHGVKGMKWGVRKVDTPHGGHIKISEKTGKATVSTQTAAAVVGSAVIFLPATPLAFLSKRVRGEIKAAKAVNKGVKADKKWRKEIDTSKKAVEVHNKAADEMDAKLPAFNNDSRWKRDGKDIDLIKDPAKQKEYDDAYFKEIANPAYSRAAIAVHGSQSPGGRYRFEIVDHTTAEVKVVDTLRQRQAMHAEQADDELSMRLTIRRDDNGHIVGMIPEDSDNVMAQSAELGEAFILEHYGIKGMRWGVRKQQEISARSLPDTGIIRRKTKIRATGGVAHPAHTDAIKAAVQKQKLKKSGTDALSTQELRDLANRLQVENQVAILTSSKGRQFVSREFEKTTKGLAREEFKKRAPAVGSKVGKKVRKGAATAAVTALI